MLLSWIFVSSYATIYFFVKKIHFFECLYFHEYDIRKSLYIFWLRRGSSIKYVWNWWGGGKIIQNANSCVKWDGVPRLMCTYALALSIFMFLAAYCLIMSCFICRNLTSPLFKKLCLSATVIFLQQDQFRRKLFYRKIIFAN